MIEQGSIEDRLFSGMILIFALLSTAFVLASLLRHCMSCIGQSPKDIERWNDTAKSMNDFARREGVSSGNVVDPSDRL